MKFLDFFAGIGGFRMGFEQVGHECVGHVEWDKYAQASWQQRDPQCDRCYSGKVGRLNAKNLHRVRMARNEAGGNRNH